MVDSRKSRLGSTNPWQLAKRERMEAADQPLLIFKRVSTPLPGMPNGKDIGFRCFTDDGGLYYCKDDKDGRPVRATEWMATHLAHHLGLSVAECAIIEDDSGQTYFGSRSPMSLASDIEVTRYLGTQKTDELGQPLSWLGQHLGRLFAFDMFIDNPDRCHRNFVLDKDYAPSRLRAIDFASARLIDLSVDHFPVEADATVWVGRVDRKTHGVHISAVMEMLDRIASVPLQFVERIIGGMPDEWLTESQREGFRGIWSDKYRHCRLSKLRVLLEHESQI